MNTSQLILPMSMPFVHRREIAGLIRRLVKLESARDQLIKDVDTSRCYATTAEYSDKLQAVRAEMNLAAESVKQWLLANANGHPVFCDGKCWFVNRATMSVMAVHADRAVDVTSEPEGN